MLQATANEPSNSDCEVPNQTNPLLGALLNRLVLDNIIPYLPISSLLCLASASRNFQSLIYDLPGVFRHLDLSTLKCAQFEIDAIDHGGQVWRNVQLDEYLTEDDFYSGPLRGVFSTLQRRHVLQDVQTLVLDGLSVTAELCNDIINDPLFNVRILSLRDVKNLNHSKLQGSLRYACRTSRPEHRPRLRGLYIFGPKDSKTISVAADNRAFCLGAEWNQRSQAALSSSVGREGDLWWYKKGRVLRRHVSEDWAHTISACNGLIAFDAVLCQGPRHRTSVAFGQVPVIGDNVPAIATFAVPPCDGCGSCPEGVMQPDCSHDPETLPLLGPPPILSSSVKAATTPRAPASSFIARCMECLRERYCAGCHKWWCEACYVLPGQAAGHPHVMIVGEDSLIDDLDPAFSRPKPKARFSKSCWECGQNCESCIDRTQKSCKKCYAGYCIIHNEGSSSTHCDCNEPRTCYRFENIDTYHRVCLQGTRAWPTLTCQWHENLPNLPNSRRRVGREGSNVVVFGEYGSVYIKNAYDGLEVS